MRILIDARFYGLENAGLGRYTINLLEELWRLDQENSYIILLRKKYYDSLHLPQNWYRVLTDFRHYSLEEQIRLPKIISKEKPDLVHFLHFNTPVFYQGKFIVTIHDLTMHKEGRKASTLPLPIFLVKRLAYKFIFRHSVKASVKILTPSHFVKDQIIQHYGVDEEKVVVIHEGLDENIMSDLSSDVTKKYQLEFPYFIYVGNTYPYKNLERAIEAVVFLNKEVKRKILLAVVSPRNIFLARLEKIINKLDAVPFVRLLGFIPDKDLGALLMSSVAFIYPSLTEGFGLQGLEAIAAGTFVAASDIPTFREIYKDNVAYFNPYDFSSIAKGMKDALEMGEGERKKLIAKGQEFIKRYSWSKMAEQTLKLYESCYRLRPGQ